MSLRSRHSSNQPNGVAKHEEHDHDHDHDHDDGHGHSHSLLSGHSHREEGHNQEAERILAAWHGAADRGSRITLIGLFSNVGLTAAKGFAGWHMHSAALLADAGHSLSDLLGDFVTLFCWRLSRKPPSQQYPFGFAKFETLGTTTVSLLLIGGALGIGFHSYQLLLTGLAETASTLPAGPLQTILTNVTAAAPLIPEAISHHAHSHSHEIVDPNAAWFAVISIVVKEWLYRITKSVADDEKSPVLLANAIHHRSDAYSSIVALFAILGTWYFPALPLDPIGGLLVSIVILTQGFGLLRGAWGDLTDASVSPRTRRAYEKLLHPLASVDSVTPGLLSVDHIRARRAGSLVYVDLDAAVAPELTINDIAEYEEHIVSILKTGRKEVAEVRIRFRPKA